MNKKGSTIVAFLAIFLTVISSAFALSLNDISLGESNLFTRIFRSFFSIIPSVSPSISCSSCSSSSCTCAVSNCNSGDVLIYNNGGCLSFPMYDKEFSNGQITWVPGSGGEYSFIVACYVDKSVSNCIPMTIQATTTTTVPTTTTQPSVTTTTLSATTTTVPTTTTQPSVTTTTLSATTTTVPTTTTTIQGTTTTTQPGASTTTTTIQGTTTTTIATTTTIPEGQFRVSSVHCSDEECTLNINTNTLNEQLVIFFEIVGEDDGRIYYSSNLNLESRSTGEKKLIISRLRSCPSGTRLELFALTYKQSNLGYRVNRVRDESFVC